MQIRTGEWGDDEKYRVQRSDCAREEPLIRLDFRDNEKFCEAFARILAPPRNADGKTAGQGRTAFRRAPRDLGENLGTAII